MATPGVVEVKEDVQEIVPLSAMLETPSEPEEVVENNEASEDAVASAADDVVQKIDEAKAEGASKEEINELRSMLRELRNDNISLKARLAVAERVQKGDFGTEGKNEEPSELEVYQAKLQEVSQRDFSQIIAVMEVNPKYEDMNVVCTADNFNDIFDRVAQYRSSENGTDFSVELLKVQTEVWSRPNPYKYMYEIIKAHHPKFAEASKPKDEKAAKPATLSAKEVLQKVPVTAPGTVANMGGGAETKGGWTAEKIDSLPESQLHTVPRDIYNKWLAGELD